jgi:hypothetical protein
MKKRAPKELAKKLEDLRDRYSELLKLREIVKQAEFKTTDEIKSAERHEPFKRRR